LVLFGAVCCVLAGGVRLVKVVLGELRQVELRCGRYGK
jgi:hypothetical protein